VTEVYDNEGKSFALKEVLNGRIGFDSLVEIDILFRIQSPYVLHSFRFFSTGECGSPRKVLEKWINESYQGMQKPSIRDTYSYIYTLYSGNVKEYFTSAIFWRQKTGLYHDFKRSFFQVALGLRCLHENGFLHLDIKPQNILYKKSNPNSGSSVSSSNSNSFNTVLADEGLAEPCIDTISNGIKTNVEKITYVYRAPSDHVEGKIQNQINPRYHYTNKSDIWSLGMSFLELARGSRHPIFLREMDVYEFHGIVNNYFSKMRISASINRYLEHREIPDDELPSLISLFVGMLALDPDSRFDIQQVIANHYFDDVRDEIIKESGEECKCLDITPVLNDTMSSDKISNGISSIMTFFSSGLPFREVFGTESGLPSQNDVSLIPRSDLNVAIYFLAVDIFMRCMPACGENLNIDEQTKFTNVSIGMALKYYNKKHDSFFNIENKEIIKELEGKIIKLFGGIINRRGPYFYANSLDELRIFQKEILDNKSAYKYYLAINLPKFYKNMTSKYTITSQSKNVMYDQFIKMPISSASAEKIVTM
jgi:serine/threonine protein kinase